MTAETAIHEPWAEPKRQHEAMLFGLWIFLATEALFFGGLFLLYAAGRWRDSAGFVAAARHSDVWFGTTNTVILLTSSFTIAVAERAVRENLMRLARAGLLATLALGLAFLVVKGFEYRKDLEENLLPGHDFALQGAGAAQFWSFYWTITLVHATHLTIGLGFIIRLLRFDRKGELAARWMGTEVTTIYWHLVDVVWVLLYPLLYLVGR